MSKNAVVFQIKYSAKNPPRYLKGDDLAAYIQERKFFDWTADYNYFEYTLNDKKVVKNKDFEHYASREGNLGMFNADKVYTKEELDEIREQLKNTDSHIWHGFISFNEENNGKFQTQEQAMHFLKQHFNDFIDRTHLDKNNIILMASLHQDTENRHIHFSFFEKEPTHLDKNGKVGFSMKGNFNQNVIDNWLISANMAVENNDDFYNARNAVIEKLREMKATVGKEFTDQEMQLKLLALSRKFPKEGRLSYWSENMTELRPEIDKLANFILCSQPEVKQLHQEFLRKLEGRRQRVDSIIQDNVGSKNHEIKANNYIDKLSNDYKARVGNLVIALAKEMRRQYKPAYYTETSRQKKYEARAIRRHAARVFNNFTGKLINTLGQVQKGMEAEFTDTVKDAETLIMREMLLQESQA